MELEKRALCFLCFDEGFTPNLYFAIVIQLFILIFLRFARVFFGLKYYQKNISCYASDNSHQKIRI